MNVICEYCKNTYRKYGLKPHYSRCKSKIEFDKNQILKELSEKKFIENYNIVEKSSLNKLPNEILFIIFSYLFDCKKDEYSSYKRYYQENYMNYCYISKRFYNLFYPSFDKILIMKDNLYKEKEKYICKSTAKEEYCLKEDELEYEIEYILVNNPHYRSSPPMKLYQIRDILDYMNKKYGNRENHLKILKELELKKKESSIKRIEIKDKRRINIDKLINKYNIHNNDQVYIDYYDNYINKGTPSLKKIEEEIIYFINRRNRKNEIIDKMNYFNLNIYINYDIVRKFIYENYKTSDEVIDILLGIQNRKNEMKTYLVKNNHIDNYKIKYFIDNIIQDYINTYHCSLDEITHSIESIFDRKNKLDEDFLKHNISQNEIYHIENTYYNYILDNNGTHKEIINFFIEKNNRNMLLNEKLLEHGYSKNALKQSQKFYEYKNLINDYVINNKLDHNYIIDYIIKNETIIQNMKEIIQNKNKNIVINDKTRNEMIFLTKNANYTNYFSCIRTLHKDLSFENVCELAIKESLIYWCKKYDTYEKAIESQIVPNTLYDKIKDLYNHLPIFSNQKYQNNYRLTISEHCICNNPPSNICGNCRKCCEKNYCPKHFL
jgi:hypothetical protein